MQVAGQALERQKMVRAGVPDSEKIAVLNSRVTVGILLGGRFRQVEIVVIRR